MATSRTVQKELESLRKEMAGLRQDYARLKRRTNATTAEAADRFGAIRGGIADTIETIRENVTEGTSSALDEVGTQFGNIRDIANECSDKTVRTVAAHPFATLAGAIAVGYLVGHAVRESR